MLTERMRAVVEQVEQLNEEEQDALAAAIQAELDEDRRWEAAMDDSYDRVLDQLIAEAKEQIAHLKGGEE